MRARAALCAALPLAFACAAADFPVAPGASISDAVTKARAAGGTNTVTLAAGDWFLETPLVFDARDAGLTVRGAGAGRTRIWGGRRLRGWRPDGDKFWSVDLPEVKDGTWNFRALVVDGALAPRACFPGGTNRFDNLGTWDLPLLPALAGHWPRKPTYAELVTMPYKAADLPDTMDFRNAEIRLYHMWSESLSTVASNDLARHVVYLSQPAAWPMGACGRRQYEVYNTREGMTAPGQWYLDRTRGKVVYWPKPGQDMSKMLVVAPRLETVVRVAGSKKGPVRGLTLADFTVQAATPPDRRAGFGGGDLPPAVLLVETEKCAAERLEVCNVGGVGVRIGGIGTRLAACDVHHVGARGVSAYGDGLLLVSNRVCHVGLQYPSSCAMGVGGRDVAVRRNEVYDSPYSGIIGGGTDILFEENCIHHVMRVLHDGAAIYGNMTRAVMRGNVVHDIVPVGKGFGASAFYYDEGALDCVIERNVAYGVPRPIHEHMTRGTQVRDNTFVADGDMAISFQRSVNCTFERNTLVLGGNLNCTYPEAVKTWEGNRVFRPAPGRADRLDIGEARPVPQPQKPRAPLAVARAETAPVMDGQFAPGEWKGRMQSLDRTPDGFLIGGSTAYLRTAWDDANLYVGVFVANFGSMEVSKGTTWGVDDGVEVSVAGKPRRAFADGRKKWVYEVAIPFAELGVSPKASVKLPFNVRVRNSQYGEWRQWDADDRTPQLLLQ
ncbi:MAG: right-handed parallel beta-helix repeat-containing protein [Kiritimatiellae bacterium]|nr:right-handed parallel beta-helix repeat-containing protein [Kiritimatiellia bacterium]